MVTEAIQHYIKCKKTKVFYNDSSARFMRRRMLFSRDCTVYILFDDGIILLPEFVIIIFYCLAIFPIVKISSYQSCDMSDDDFQ